MTQTREPAYFVVGEKTVAKDNGMGGVRLFDADNAEHAERCAAHLDRMERALELAQDYFNRPRNGPSSLEVLAAIHRALGRKS